MSLPALLGLNALLVAALMLAVWVASVRVRDASIVDSFWGLGFALVGVVTLIVTDGYPARRWLVTLLTTTWGVRLSLHIWLRNRGMGEDVRYQAMRARHGDRFPFVSLFTVFGLQGVLLWFISLPVQVTQVAPLPARISPLDLFGAGVWLVGFLFEAVGDAQLARFKADPANQGRVLDRGLWRYTRHPNYFGDALLWWGIFLVCAATPGGALTVLSPLTMTYLLARVSGVPMLEAHLAETRPGYREYVQRTSAFLPRPPRDRSPVQPR